MLRALPLFAVLLAFWAGLSGDAQLHNPFLLVSGIVTCAGVTYLMARHDLLVRWGVGRQLKTLSYLPWLLWQVVAANIRVIKIVWSPRMAIDPTVVDVPTTLSTPTGRAVFANSITLTPGTVTLEVEDDHLKVHALTKQDAEGVLDGSMEARVRKLELGS